MQKKEYIVFQGTRYCIDGFKHPGGSIIKFWANKDDATSPILQFHSRELDRVKAIMRCLPQEPAVEPDALTRDFMALNAELRREGLFDPSYFHIAWRLAEIVLVGAAGFWLLNSTTGWLAGCILLGLCQGFCGWVQHECGHYSFTCVPKVDRFLNALTIGVGMGSSARWWRSAHNRHHAMPQRVGYDVDLETMPLILFNLGVLRGHKTKSRWLCYQQYLFLPVDTLLANLLHQFYVTPKYCLERGQYLHLIPMTLHQLVFGWAIGWQAWLVSSWVMTAYLHGNFALAHTHLPLADDTTDWLRYAFVHTSNIRSSWLCDHWMMYLNYQVDHHLFPSMPQHKLRHAHERILTLARKHNLPYIEYSYWEAWKLTLGNLARVAEQL